MTDTKHTPGPWTISDEIGEMNGRIIYDEEYGIGEAWDLNGNPENAANAHLIAAAPDLFEALESLLSELDFTETYPFPSEAKARAAIAKAKGQTE